MTKVLWTVVQASKVLGLSGAQVRKLLVAGELAGERVPRPGAVYGKREANWQVDPDSVKAYLAREAERKAAAKAAAVRAGMETVRAKAGGLGAVLREAAGAPDLRPVLREIRDALLALVAQGEHDGHDDTAE